MNSLEQKQMYKANCDDVLIREAFVKNNYLTVTNKSGRIICVNFDKIPALKAIRECDRAHFTIQANGSCLHWEHSDTHLDFESFLYIESGDEFLDKVATNVDVLKAMEGM